MLTTLAIENYRSLRRLVLPLQQLTLITGPNGSGKSSLYRSLRLLADAARNGAVAALAREGGLPSTLWAGPERVGRAVRDGQYPVQGTVRSKPVSLRLGFAGEEFGYAIDFGLPTPSGGRFALDPEIKREAVWRGPVLRPATLLADRHNAVVRTRDEDGSWAGDMDKIGPGDSMLSEYADPRRAPELLITRERIRSWRFYDQFRTDATAPARTSRIGTRTPVLDHDGGDLAAGLGAGVLVDAELQAARVQVVGDVGHAVRELRRVREQVSAAVPGTRQPAVVDRDGAVAPGRQAAGHQRVRVGQDRLFVVAALVVRPVVPAHRRRRGHCRGGWGWGGRRGVGRTGCGQGEWHAECGRQQADPDPGSGN